jgi:ribonuclease P protein component
MSDSQAQTLTKQERVCSRIVIDKLFKGGKSHSLSAYPLRVVYMLQRNDENTDVRQPKLQFLVSVPKKCFKRAVKRNRVKRQVREAYRKNKARLDNLPDNESLVMAFIWLDDKTRSSADVETDVVSLINRIGERI